MIYHSILKDFLKNESNAVKKMYLNELILNWKKVQTLMDDEVNEENFEQLVKTFNTYLTLLNNPKFRVSNKDTQNTFEPNHPIFGPSFIEDLITYILKPTGILNNQSLQLAFQPFHFKAQLRSYSFMDALLKHEISFSNSESIFSLSMKMDLQYRPFNKKVFAKQAVNIPLMLFYICKDLSRFDLLRVDIYREQLKVSNPNALLTVICESVEKECIPLIDDYKRNLFILKKCVKNNDFTEIAPDVVFALSNLINDYIKEKYINNTDFIKRGCSNPVLSKAVEPEKKIINKNRYRRKNEKPANR